MMLNKRQLLSILVILCVTAITVSNTWALITSDSKTPKTAITVGKIQIITEPDTSFMVIEGVSPGSSGTLYQTITNSGSLPGKLRIDFGSIQENKATEVPAANTGKDTLLHSIKVNIKLVKASDGTLVKQLRGSASNLVPIISCSGLSISNIPMDANTAYKLVVYYEIPTKTDNGIQGKKLTFDVTYTLSS